MVFFYFTATYKVKVDTLAYLAPVYRPDNVLFIFPLAPRHAGCIGLEDKF